MPNSAITRGLSSEPHPPHTPHFGMDEVRLNKHGGDGTIPLSKMPGFRTNEKFQFLRTSAQTLLNKRAARAARCPLARH